jgi:hypothetical protein
LLFNITTINHHCSCLIIINIIVIHDHYYVLLRSINQVNLSLSRSQLCGVSSTWSNRRSAAPGNASNASKTWDIIRSNPFLPKNLTRSLALFILGCLTISWLSRSCQRYKGQQFHWPLGCCRVQWKVSE